MVSAIPWLPYPQERDPEPILQEAAWVPGPVWLGATFSPPLGFTPWTVQPITSCYTDYAIPAHFECLYSIWVTSSGCVCQIGIGFTF